jgi:hypothetical protein
MHRSTNAAVALLTVEFDLLRGELPDEWDHEP